MDPSKQETNQKKAPKSMANKETEEFQFLVYNTMTQQKEVFKPKIPRKVGMYVCGVTAYDFSYLRHARAAVAFDVLFRYLQHLGYEVTYVRNFTDVDDKIINKEFGYVVDEDVFFSVDKFPNYGKLSGQKLENNRAAQRREWKELQRCATPGCCVCCISLAAKPGEPSWDSPWGCGRPGWHIECSAMSAHYLSFKFDIHCVGLDLIFPHHENEIAQSCAACQESDVSYWGLLCITERYHPLALRYFLINAHYRSPLNYSVVQLEGLAYVHGHGWMSVPLSILGVPAFFDIGPLPLKVSSVVYCICTIGRFSLLPVKITQRSCTLKDCQDALSQLQEEISKDGKPARTTPDAQECISKLRSEFQAKMSDDLSTSLMLTGAFLEALKLVNSLLTTLKKKQQKQQRLLVIQSLIEVVKEVKKVLVVLGLQPPYSYTEILLQLKEKALTRAGLVEDDVVHLINERAEVRRNKDFWKSDQMRADLQAKGIALMDVSTETIWRPCVPVQQEPEVLTSGGQKVPAETALVKNGSLDKLMDKSC
ncbi:hypothetical protein REPUB_Repub18cG0001600 [Reevesia pubescens]